MANANPNPATRFSSDRQPEKRGRPKEARDRITRGLLNALADDFAEHGASAVAQVREQDPTGYLRVLASIVPKEIEITRPLDGLNEDQLTAAINLLSETIRQQAPPAEDEPEQPTVN